jgi:hypothetical protein
MYKMAGVVRTVQNTKATYGGIVFVSSGSPLGPVMGIL